MTGKDAAERLAEATGEPVEKFEADEYEMPDIDELEKVEEELNESFRDREMEPPDDFFEPCVPISELEELYDRLLEIADDRERQGMDSNGMCYRNAAKELEALIEEHSNE